MNKQKIIIGITGASGAIYAQVLLKKIVSLHSLFEAVSIVMSDNAKTVWQQELEDESYKKFPFTFYNKNDFNAPFASGSAQYQSMIICPCSMGTMGRIAAGISNDLITRAADVILKERRKLILVTRETPLSLIHINNMKTITEAGGIICPASPSFYSKPSDFSQLASTVTDRALDLCGVETNTYRWKS
ncbi:MAG: UbiX family flavin prenyltransferase [Bacteroidetes bacterium]|nr:UbiX family flavin prenyltransferase [Bacteroidota bacterium]MBV6461743.1 Flavin prenyltransferase UbiX [Flavobacteriales bacterium]WKZ75146.1 MAG: UbiX family flavin prenyltransferase [Vicingaceae bacterium]MCL4815528.1 UbiX family flavin prenyltransferase [Flavobacteriales bacterium]NOG95962.1 UbiX family flavin prenyltransferase [Bacteroidota bacterium]